MTRLRNTIDTAPYERLVEVIKAMTTTSTTKDLGDAAALKDPDGLMGALRMLEVRGLVHELRGQKRQSLWAAGPRQGSRPANLEPLRPYEQIVRLIKEHGRTLIVTDAILHEVWLDSLNTKGRERVLGALKALAAMGLVAWENYSPQAIGWCWRDATYEYPYRADAPAPDDYLVENSRGEVVGSVDEVTSFQEWDHDPWGDL